MKGRIPLLRVDGGAARNNLLMQHQADVLGIPVRRGQTLETTALGAAFLAGLAVGFWSDKCRLSLLSRTEAVFDPKWSESRCIDEVINWHKAVLYAVNVIK